MNKCQLCGQWYPQCTPLNFRAEFNEEKQQAEPSLQENICACDKRQWIFYLGGTANRYNEKTGRKLLTDAEIEAFYKQRIKKSWDRLESKE